MFPIVDYTFEEELEVAVVDGRVAQVDGERVTESAYEWTGVLLGLRFYQANSIDIRVCSTYIFGCFLG
jgi:hypothetical protein